MIPSHPPPQSQHISGATDISESTTSYCEQRTKLLKEEALHDPVSNKENFNVIITVNPLVLPAQ